MSSFTELNVFSTIDIMTKGKDYFPRILKNNYPDWMIKQSERKSHHKCKYWPRGQEKCLHLCLICFWSQ